MLLGKVISEKRKSLGLSQADLAKGICTQATISKMEQSNQPPLTDILAKLCLRLGLTPNDVLSDFTDPEYNQQRDLFKSIDSLIDHYQFEKAEKEFTAISTTQLKDNLLTRYHYVKGNIQMLVHNELDNAIFEFNLSIQLSKHQDTTYLLAMSGLGIAYSLKKDNDKAAFYFDTISDSVSKINIDTDTLNDVLKLMNNCGKFYSDVGQYEKSNQITFATIDTVKKFNLMPYIDHCYYRLGFNTYFSGTKSSHSVEKTLDYMNQADILADLANNQVLIKHIANFRNDMSSNK